VLGCGGVAVAALSAAELKDTRVLGRDGVTALSASKPEDTRVLGRGALRAEVGGRPHNGSRRRRSGD
jgi:hypothetical protein